MAMARKTSSPAETSGTRRSNNRCRLYSRCRAIAPAGASHVLEVCWRADSVLSVRFVEHDRRSIRLPEYDYRTAGAYFVTLCTRDRLPLFGEVRDGEMHENETGRRLALIWLRWVNSGRMPPPYDFVVMPNHVHGVMWLPGVADVVTFPVVGPRADVVGAKRPPYPEDVSTPNDLTEGHDGSVYVDASPLHTTMTRRHFAVRRQVHSARCCVRLRDRRHAQQTACSKPEACRCGSAGTTNASSARTANCRGSAGTFSTIRRTGRMIRTTSSAHRRPSVTGRTSRRTALRAAR